MALTPGLRKLAVTAHVMSSVGWFGAVAAFLALAIAGVSFDDVDTVRGSFVAMNLIGEFVIVPLGIAALGTGLLVSLPTQWGLLRYYWVTVKLVLTIGATILLLVHQFTAVATAARRVVLAPAGTRPAVEQLGNQLIVDSGLALAVLTVTTVLSIYKPWGRTRHGRRVAWRQAQENERVDGQAERGDARGGT
jgi:hypothetical protein